MSTVQLEIPPASRAFLADTIRSAGGNEVYFLGRVSWENASLARLDEVDVFARGNQVSTPAIIEGAEDWDIAIHNHPGGNLTPSEADVGIAGELGNREVGFAIIDDLAENVYLVVPPFDRNKLAPIDEAEVREIFSGGGLLERTFRSRASSGEAYEAREGQLEMALEVTRSLNDNGVVALEAGTGVGKSFAYLIPSILWAAKNKKRVVVSTNTIHLQEQLVASDLPFLKEVLSHQPFSFALIKGRQNYACLRKANEASSETSSLFDSDGSVKSLEDLIEWTRKTSDGSLADLGMTPDEEVWDKLKSETDKSLKVNCRFYQECFYYRARRRAFKSDLIVANHHLFFADLALRRESNNYQWNLLLPGYERVIFDEAHHLEDVASKHFGLRLSREGVRNRFGRLVSRRDRKKGLLPFLARKLRSEGASVAAEHIEQHLLPLVPELAERVDEAFESIAYQAEAESERQNSGGGPASSSSAVSRRNRESRQSFQLRLDKDPDTAFFRREVLGGLASVKKELELLGRVNQRAVGALKTAAGLEEERRASLLLDLTSLAGRNQQLLDAIERFSDSADENQVRWLELRQRKSGPNLTCASSPIRVAGDLAESVYRPLKTVVLTSATLSVAGSIDFFGDRVGLDKLGEEGYAFHAHASPFDFAKQTLTLVPTDFPEPRVPDYEPRVADTVLDAARLMGGRIFVLFTSYALLRRTHERLEGPLAALGITSLCQGDTNRSELLRRFRSSPRNVLFGTDSFWEGVDVRGEALECVILTRLPFRVPSEPLQVARMEEIETRGLSPFMSFTVPQAVLKFKQGFGRLIRSKTDRGVVLVLDRRIITQRYGQRFIRSLPPTRWVKAPTKELLKEIGAFFACPTRTESLSSS